MQAIGGIYNGSEGASCPSPNGRGGRAGHEAVTSGTQKPLRPTNLRAGHELLPDWRRVAPSPSGWPELLLVPGRGRLRRSHAV